MATNKTHALDIKFKIPWTDMASTLTSNESSEGVSAISEKELSAKVKKILISEAIEFFAPYGIPMALYKATVEMTSDVTAEITFVKKDASDVKLVLEDVYFDEASGKILQARPELG